MSRILFAAKHLFVQAVICRSRGGLSANEKEGQNTSNYNNNNNYYHSMYFAIIIIIVIIISSSSIIIQYSEEYCTTS